MSQDIYVVIEHLNDQVADISYMMLAAAKALAGEIGGDVVAVLLGHNAQELANDLAADRVLYLDHPALAGFTSDTYLKTLSNLFQGDLPRTILFGSTSIGAGLASVLSARHNLPLVGLCRSFDAEGNFAVQICGGKIMVEGDLPGPTVLVTMIPGGYKPEEGQSSHTPEVTPMAVPDLEELRIELIGYIEPEAGDVDISNEAILISIGRGIQTQDNIELAEELAELLGGVVCASRPVVDQGWLPTSRMVGKSGQTVKPKLYLAMGISGAPEHVEAITESETIIAINTDPDAPIFDVAQYGAEVDMLEFSEVLIELLEEMREG
jgi:electron transfer flavoprotein alpha subunit